MAITQGDHVLNLLRFDHPREIIEASFFTEKKNKGMKPLRKHEFPKGLKTSDEVQRLYTDFKERDDADYHLEVNLDKSRHLASHYYNRRLFTLFKGTADVRKLNFINSNELWFRDEGADEDGSRAFKRFEVRTAIERYTDGPELLVNYQGHSFVLPHTVLNYGGPTTDLNWVVYDGYCFKYEEVPEGINIDHGKMFAVVNRDIRIRKKLGYPQHNVKNKVKRYYDELEWLREEYLLKEVFQKYFPLKDEHWYRPGKERIYTVPASANKLVFKGEEMEKVPHEGMKKHGPYRPPDERHVRILFIAHQDDRKVANRLTKYLKKGHGIFPGLPQYANVPMQFMEDHIVFEDEEDPLEEIQAQLQEMPFDSRMQHLAIYVSPIHKDDPDAGKRNVYYRLKEELLKHNVSSQVIYRESVADKNFQYFLPNISVAILAKLGGIPWQLESPPGRELVVGIGAFSPRDKNRKYVGSAFCFSNRGGFRGFQCFTKEETGMLAGSIREAVRNYVAEYDKPERLVIHYYKKMSYKERKPIEQMLRNLGLKEVPVVVVTINKTPSRDVVLFDRDYGGKMPLSGTYVRLDHHQLLLCNNTRYRTNGKAPRNWPFPVKVKIESDERGFMYDEENVREIMQQVYQFSRIYWKSITQQNLPVTIKYPEMVARMVPYFKGRTLPGFGRENLWFL